MSSTAIDNIKDLETLLMAKNHPDCQHLMPSEIFDYLSFTQVINMSEAIREMTSEQLAPAVEMLKEKFRLKVPETIIIDVFCVDYDSLVATLENKLNDSHARDDFMQTLWHILDMSEGEEDYPRDRLGLTRDVMQKLYDKNVIQI